MTMTPNRGVLRLPSLGARLGRLYSWVEEGACVADIGTDHGWLPIHLAASGRCLRVYACDKHPEPLAVAAEHLRFHGMSERIALRLGDGLAALKEGEADTLILAGMGWKSIRRILQGRDLWARGIRHLLLQSNTQEELLRLYCLLRGWVIQEEALVEEGEKFYLLFRVDVPEKAEAGDLSEKAEEEESSFSSSLCVLPLEAWLVGGLADAAPRELLRRYLEYRIQALRRPCSYRAEDPPLSLDEIPPHAAHRLFSLLLARLKEDAS